MQRGVKDVFVAGDLVDGYKVYRGQLNNLVAWKIDDQVAIVADVLNRFPDLHFYAIGGNHDYSFEQHNGANPLALLETKIKNFTKTQFKKLWEAIQHFEGFQTGKIVEVYRIIRVQKIKKNVYQFCREDGYWMTESQCIRYSKTGRSFKRARETFYCWPAHY